MSKDLLADFLNTDSNVTAESGLGTPTLAAEEMIELTTRVTVLKQKASDGAVLTPKELHEIVHWFRLSLGKAFILNDSKAALAKAKRVRKPAAVKKPTALQLKKLAAQQVAEDFFK